MEIKFKLDSQSLRDTLYLTFEVDETKFTEELAKELASDWLYSQELYDDYGSYKNAVLRSYAVQCFRLLISKNGWITEDMIAKEFKNGVDGFYDFETMGLTLKNISDYELELEIDEIEEVH